MARRKELQDTTKVPTGWCTQADFDTAVHDDDNDDASVQAQAVATLPGWVNNAVTLSVRHGMDKLVAQQLVVAPRAMD